MNLSTVRYAIRKSSTTIKDGCKTLDVQRGQKVMEIESRKRIVFASCMVCILFFLWGLAYGLLDVMNMHVKESMGITRTQAALMALSYYAAYSWCPALIAGPLIKKHGYRPTFVLGLTLLALGSFAFAGSANFRNFSCMCLSMHAIGTGVSALERSANPYAVNCGPKNSRALRILIAQCMAAVGTIVAPQVAKLALQYKTEAEAPVAGAQQCVMGYPRANALPTVDDLTPVIKLYMYVGSGIIGLAVLASAVLFRTNLVPEVPQEVSPKSECGVKVWKHPIFSLKYTRLWLGFFANFFNMACQVMVAQFIMEHFVVNACATTGKAANYFTYSQSVFLAGRIIPAILVFWPRIFKPRYVLAAFIMGAIVSPAVTATSYGTAAVVSAGAIMFFEAPSFPMIFESATVGLGEWASLGETIMTQSIVGGGLGPIIMGELSSKVGLSKSWALPASFFFLVWCYALANNLVPAFRHMLDASEERDHASQGVESSHSSIADRDDEFEAATVNGGAVEKTSIPQRPALVKFFGGK